MRRLVLGVSLVAALLCGSACSEEMADEIAKVTGIRSGVCCILGAENPELPVKLATNTRFLVHVLDAHQDRISACRQQAAKTGLTIQRFIAECTAAQELPYADSMVDLVLVLSRPAWMHSDKCLAEISRVLRPGGKVVLADAAKLEVPASLESLQLKKVGAVVLEKQTLDGADDWSHWEHAPDNNPVSADSVIRAPYMTQWLGQPYYIAMPAITTAAGGRTFVAMGHIAHHEREEPWLNTILARNGYNGAELWRRRLPDGYLVHRSAFIATDDTFYMIDPSGPGCLKLDPETGEEKGRIRIPEIPGEWKWMALEDGVLYALVGRESDPAETTIIRSQSPAWSWGELSAGYYQEPRIPWGFGETLLAYDVKRDTLLWNHKEEGKIDSRGMALGERRVYFFVPDVRIACLDAKTGKEAWSNADPETRALINEPGKGLSSTPGFRTACYCVYTPKALFFEGQTQMNLVAVSKDDGHLLWHRPKTTSNPNVVYVDGNILCGIGEEGSTLLLNPETGETLEDLGFKKRSCARLTVTPDSFFVRGWPEGLTRYDRATKRIEFDGSVRPACNDGVIGANGLLYIGPWLCDCNLTLMGTVALCSAPAPLVGTGNVPPKVIQGNGSTAAAPFPSSEYDWATYRGNNARSASSKASVESPLSPLWHWKAREAAILAVPTTAGGLAFLAGDDGSVRAIDAESGTLKWEFQTAGPILLAPTVAEGRAYVGSGDGYVYALEAATGRLLWKALASSRERRIMFYGYLCSTWPVNSGVLVQDGTAYFASGVVDYDGTNVFGVDSATGDLRWQNTSSGSLNSEHRKGVSAQGFLTSLDGKLWMAGGNVVSPAPYDLRSGEYTGRTPSDGSPHANRGEEVGVLAGKFLVYGGRPQFSTLENVVNPEMFMVSAVDGAPREFSRGMCCPTWNDELVVLVPTREDPPIAFATKDWATFLETGAGEVDRPTPIWRASGLSDSTIMALALASDSVLAACRTPLPRNTQPRWRLCMIDRKDGTISCDYDLPGPVRLNGLSIDRDGRVLVALADGGVYALGGRNAFQKSLTRLVESAGSEPERKKGIAQVRDMLESVHDEEGRQFLISSLEKLGDDVYGPLREKGVLTTWRLAGPFPWDSENTTDKSFFNEQKVNVDRPVKVGNEKLEWQRYVTIDGDGMVDLSGLFGSKERVAAYACAEAELADDQPLELRLGSNDGFVCWFNGQEVGRFEGGRLFRADQDILSVQGKKGTNTVLVKVLQEGGKWSVGVRLTDSAGKGIPLRCVTP